MFSGKVINCKINVLKYLGQFITSINCNCITTSAIEDVSAQLRFSAYYSLRLYYASQYSNLIRVRFFSALNAFRNSYIYYDDHI